MRRPQGTVKLDFLSILILESILTRKERIKNSLFYISKASTLFLLFINIYFNLYYYGHFFKLVQYFLLNVKDKSLLLINVIYLCKSVGLSLHLYLFIYLIHEIFYFIKHLHRISIRMLHV